jgi:hypothetical protein
VASLERANASRLTKPAVVCDPDKQSGPRCIEVPPFVAPGNGQHAWQCLHRTCGAAFAS